MLCLHFGIPDGSLVGRKDSSMLPKTINWVIDPSILRMRDKAKKEKILDFSSSFVNSMVCGDEILFYNKEHHRLFDIMKRSIKKYDVSCYLTKDKGRGDYYRMKVCFGSDELTFIARFNFRGQLCFITSIHQ